MGRQCRTCSPPLSHLHFHRSLFRCSFLPISSSRERGSQTSTRAASRADRERRNKRENNRWLHFGIAPSQSRKTNGKSNPMSHEEGRHDFPRRLTAEESVVERWFSFGQSVNALSSICLSNHTHNRETKTEGSSPCTEVESGITPEAEGPSEQ